jgi:hypothetical protein
LLLPCAFQSTRRTSSTARLASWQTWKESNATWGRNCSSRSATAVIAF